MLKKTKSICSYEVFSSSSLGGVRTFISLYAMPTFITGLVSLDTLPRVDAFIGLLFITGPFFLIYSGVAVLLSHFSGGIIIHPVFYFPLGSIGVTVLFNVLVLEIRRDLLT